MDAARAASPTLRITRHGDTGVAGDFAFDVWNPFTGHYQPAASLPEGLRRVDQLASLIGQMHARKHPREAALTDAPSADMPSADMPSADMPSADMPPAGAPHQAAPAADEWAELRVNPADRPTYDTRRSDQLTWTRSSGGKLHATETVCNSVGYGPTASRTAAARR
jgi:hypothetical protein